MSVTATEPTSEKKPAKRKVAPLKEPKPPRIRSFIDVPFSEEAQVTLSQKDFTDKTHVMLRTIRERENLEARFESVKAEYKQMIKSKQEEITELEGELQSGTEKRSMPLIARFFPKKKLKRVLDAGTKKKLRDEPMTKAEVLEHSQPALIDVPASNPSASAGEGHIANAVPGALEGLGVPVNQPAPKDGDVPADPARTNPQNVEDIPVEGGDDKDEVSEE